MKVENSRKGCVQKEDLELAECFLFKSVRYIQRNFTFLLQSLQLGEKWAIWIVEKKTFYSREEVY